MLLEVESWARHGDLERARRPPEPLLDARLRATVPSTRVFSKELADVLSGTNPDYQALSGLRRQIDDLLGERYGPAPA